LWLGSDGNYTITRPVSPDISVIVGAVIRSHATEGVIFAHPQLVPRLSGLSDTIITSVADNELIAWDNSVSSFINQKGRLVKTTRTTTTYTILISDYVVFANTDSAGYTVTLPVGVEGQTLKIINSGSSGNSLAVSPDGLEHLLGANSDFVLDDGETLMISYNVTDGWY